MEDNPKVRVFFEYFVLFSCILPLPLDGFGIVESIDIHSPLWKFNVTLKT
jgi:hypothetical protein